jgi:hypothetical protein
LKQHKGKKRRRFERVLAFGQYVMKIQNMLSEYPENVEVKELPKFNAVGKKRTKCWKNWCYV